MAVWLQAQEDYHGQMQQEQFCSYGEEPGSRGGRVLAGIDASSHAGLSEDWQVLGMPWGRVRGGLASVAGVAIVFFVGILPATDNYPFTFLRTH